MSWKTSFKICAVIILVMLFVVGISVYVKRSARADVKAITLSRDDLIEMNNLTLEEAAVRADYTAKMTAITNHYQAIRERNKVPGDFVNDLAGNTITGFRPQTPEEKDKAAHSQQ